MTRGWLHVAIVPAATVLATACTFRISLVEPFSGFALFVLVLVLAALASGWSTKGLARRYRVAGGVASLALIFFVSRAIATQMAVEAVRAEVRHLLRELELRGGGKVPNQFDVHGSRYFRAVSVGPGRGGDGIRARFALPDRTVVEYVSASAQWAAESNRECSRQIQPRWYRRSRC